ncbi:MAG: Ni/Fe hydrogenase subunit alpha [Anaerolineales bacterium]|nr:Ni/Fe hydrogenase subunit alpha [Anaerolineales bacterium]
MSNRIEVHHVTRVEGHGNIVVEMDNGKFQDCRFEIVETPRFFEAMLRGRHYSEASHITSRICGICATGHAVTSLQATENALGIEISEQTKYLRKLTFHGEILDSHILHVYMLVAPDFLGVGSVIPLAQTHRSVVLRALKMKKLAGDICAVVSGRHTHPIAMTVGGFTHFAKPDELAGLRDRLVDIREDVDATVELFASLPWPEFERETEYVSLHHPNEYAFVDGEILTTDGARFSLENYRDVTNEFIVRHSSGKHTRNLREAYMVGALARLNNNYDQLHPRAKSAADTLGLKPLVVNPYLNSAAQVVEIVHCVEDAIDVIDHLLNIGVSPEQPAMPSRQSGNGVGACEVPRGLLIHNYEIGEDGLLTGANCIIPTNQNLANIEMDMHSLMPIIESKPYDAIKMDLEMLVRAYDPCISCSVQVMDIEDIE